MRKETIENSTQIKIIFQNFINLILLQKYEREIHMHAYIHTSMSARICCTFSVHEHKMYIP